MASNPRNPPLFGEQQAIEYFSNLAIMNQSRRNLEAPTPYILSSLSSFQSLFLREPLIYHNPSSFNPAQIEARRLAHLLFKHASLLPGNFSRRYIIKAYFPKLFEEMDKSVFREGKEKSVEIRMFLTELQSVFGALARGESPDIEMGQGFGGSGRKNAYSEGSDEARARRDEYLRHTEEQYNQRKAAEDEMEMEIS